MILGVIKQICHERVFATNIALETKFSSSALRLNAYFLQIPLTSMMHLFKITFQEEKTRKKTFMSFKKVKHDKLPHR